MGKVIDLLKGFFKKENKNFNNSGNVQLAGYTKDSNINVDNSTNNTNNGTINNSYGIEYKEFSDLDKRVDVVERAVGDIKGYILGESDYIRDNSSPLQKINIDEFKKTFIAKSIKIPKENIIKPTARNFINILLNASISDEFDIRNLYANLLASSMNKVVKDDVHPSFVEIIKQLSPDEAKILNHVWANKGSTMDYPTITLKALTKDNKGFVVVVNKFSNIGELASCEYPLKICEYLDNMVRLGLFKYSEFHFINSSVYDQLKNHKFIKDEIEKLKYDKEFLDNFKDTSLEEGIVSMTNFGKLFCKVCISQD